MNEPSKKSNRILWLAIIGFIAVVAFFNAAVGGNDRDATPRPTSRPAATAEPATYYVLYRVSGNGRRADVTYENDSGNSEQIDAVEIEWKKGQTMAPGDFVYLSAQSADDTGRTITCEILVNGEVVEKATSTGRYVIASCSGSVGD